MSQGASSLRAGHTVEDLGHGASASWLPGGRLYLQHGPINLIVSCDGSGAAIARVNRRLRARFPGWLGALVSELPRLQMPESGDLVAPQGDIARRMYEVVHPYRDSFVTCMAAVAGAVADHALDVLASTAGVERGFVNNGGDIALYLREGRSIRVGLVPELHGALARGEIEVRADSPVRGIATSGWDGRSLSFGIADAVTVLAKNAAAADVAATLIANAVNVEHSSIERQPADEIDDMTDLGRRKVTVSVPRLGPQLIDAALDAGGSLAAQLCEEKLIVAAVLSVQGRGRTVGSGAFPGLPEPHEPHGHEPHTEHRFERCDSHLGVFATRL